MTIPALDRLHGCLLGSAIGDALGAPAEGLYWTEVRARYGRLTDFVSYDNVPYASGLPGAGTDDTALRHLMCLAILEKGGRIDPGDAGQVWIDHLDPARFWSPDRITHLKLMAGVDPWEAGRGNIASACPTMAMTPIGMVNAGDPQQAYADGYATAGLNGDGVNQAAAATIAAGVAAAFAPGATAESVVATMRERSAPLVRRAIDLALELADRSADVGTFTERFYERLLDWWSRPHRTWSTAKFANGTGIESVPVAMALLRLCGGDPERTIVEAASFGRDADAIASICGAVVGALHGATGLPARWVGPCEQANQELFRQVPIEGVAGFASLAQRLLEVLRREACRHAERACELNAMLDGTGAPGARAESRFLEPGDRLARSGLDA